MSSDVGEVISEWNRTRVTSSALHLKTCLTLVNLEGGDDISISFMSVTSQPLDIKSVSCGGLYQTPFPGTEKFS